MARSSAQGKYHAMAHTVSEITWVRSLLYEMQVMVSIPIKMYCDHFHR